MATHYNVTVRVNTNQLNKALKKYNIKLEKIAFTRLLDAAKVGQEEAQKGFDDAVYDGVFDAKVFVDSSMHKRTVEVIATGHSVPFIEYGTGVRARKKAVKGPSQSGKKDYWFFSSKGGKVKLNAGGNHAHNTYWRKTKDVSNISYETVDRKGHNRAIPEALVKSGKGGLFYENSRGERFSVTATYPEDGPMYSREQTKPYRVDHGIKKNSYITRGNPPNNIMRHAKHVIIRQFYAAYGKPYSGGE